MAAEAIGFYGRLEVLYPPLRFSAPYVPVVESLWLLVRTAGYHKAGVGALLQNLRFVDNPPRVLPTIRPVRATRNQPHLLACPPLSLSLRPLKQWFCQSFEPWVPDE